MSVFVTRCGVTSEVYTWTSVNASHCTSTITSFWQYFLALRQPYWHWTNRPTVRQTERDRKTSSIFKHIKFFRFMRYNNARLVSHPYCEKLATELKAAPPRYWGIKSLQTHTWYAEYIHPFKSFAPITPGTPLTIPVHGHYLVLQITSLWPLTLMIQLMMWQRFPWSVYSSFGETEWGHMLLLHATKTYWHHQTAVTI